ncbi:GNAT family N-acetyltransferase [Paenibacillus sp. N4]|uniref:GNAT family N-acetyltransferase n=1 Tax=Paenibacillus vietnamensis TaxID=2590547 RepID=UPI001CD0EF44|nr:GNAT family N-acetyltransferase [Paenibacillus vietnamensis]MCA0755151.1 GNAT family N-acetyltransferase [Paenibacillus vietnamensis]
MANEWKIEQLASIHEHLDELSELLIEVVEDGASIGFLPPLTRSEAEKYWQSVIAPDTLLFIAAADGRIAGSVQLQLSMKQNGGHRAEIAKLMTHPAYRRKGIARALMQHAEQRAKLEGRTLLVLDTREGDASNLLYASLGYIQAGRIPDYARSANGQLDATIFYYKKC